MKQQRPILVAPEVSDNSELIFIKDSKMILKEIIQELETSKDPVYKMLRKGETSHILAIGFKKNMLLKKHKSDIPARIVVIKGEVVYHNENGSTTLSLYEEYEIPVKEFHWVVANEDSLMLVMKGN